MPTFRITAPDGNDYDVDAPEGATEEQALAHFQSQWKPERSDANYSNEGRNNPKPVKRDTAHRKLFNLALGKELGPIAGDVSAGAGRTLANLVRTGEDLVRGRPLFSSTPTAEELITGKPRQYLTQGLTDYANEAYKEAGPLATAANVAGDMMVGGAVNRVSGEPAMRATAQALNKAAPGMPKVLKGALSSGVGAAVGGGATATALESTSPESRASGALSGAGIGLGLGGVGGGIATAVKPSGAQGALARAEKYLKKTLGQGRMDKVTNNLDIPRELPMSTAAAAGSDELASLERTVRATTEPKSAARWTALDDRTRAAAWDKTGEAVDDSVSALVPRKVAVEDAMKPTQEALNKVKFKSDDADALTRSLENVRKSPLFQTDSSGQRELNKLMAEVSAPGVTLGGLADLDTRLGQAQNAYNLSDRQARAVRDVIRSKIDSLSDGAWSKAHADLSGARADLEKSAAANSVLSQFQEPIGGGAKGRTRSGAPEIKSQGLQSAINKYGVDVSDPLAPRDVMDPQDRQRLEMVVDALRKAENPTSGGIPASPIKGLGFGNAALDARGNPIPGSTNGFLINILREAAEKLGGSRGEATRRGLDIALRSPTGWQKMLDAGVRSKEITASDAAMLARILRGAGATAGEAGESTN